MITLWHRREDGLLVEGGAVWTWTSYTQSPCPGGCGDDCEGPHADECAVCDEPVMDMDLYLCLDGGDSAHRGCVVIHTDYPHEAGYLTGCPACMEQCFCTPGHTQCVFCAIFEEEVR